MPRANTTYGQFVFLTNPYLNLSSMEVALLPPCSIVQHDRLRILTVHTLITFTVALVTPEHRRAACTMRARTNMPVAAIIATSWSNSPTTVNVWPESWQKVQAAWRGEQPQPRVRFPKLQVRLNAGDMLLMRPELVHSGVSLKRSSNLRFCLRSWNLIRII